MIDFKQHLPRAAATSTLSARPARRRLRTRALSIPRPRPELVALLVLAAVLNLWALDRNGWANEYYSAAIRSMSSNWHAFLYSSFDSAGVMTVDKPPLALWVQALSARAFGFHSLSILVPQALMGMATVGLVYDLTRRHFGRIAGFVAGLVLVTTPITVAISRHNNPDALLILCCTAALWFFVRALDDGCLRWLVLCGVAIGLGFETKMAVALMVVPGIAAAWLWLAPRGRLAAVRQLAAGGVAMVAVGMAWPLLIALTPASDRPWVSGTSDNSIWSLILGYNGLGRLTGQSGGPQAFGNGNGGGGPFGGPTGVLRLLDSSLGGQAGWLLGFAIVGGAAILVASRLRRADARTGWIIAVGGAFVTTAVAFSFAEGIFHPYYVSLLAPFTAALVGAGAAQLLDGRRAARVLGPLALAAGVATEIVVLGNNPGELGWLPVVLVPVAVVAAVALATIGARRVRAAALAAALAVLMIAPATWAVQTLGHTTSGTFPAGGPASTAAGGGFGGGGPGGPGGAPGGRGMAGPPPSVGAGAPPAGGPPAGGAPMRGGPGGPGGGPGGGSRSLTAISKYVQQHGGGTIGVSSQQGASSSIIDSDTNVAALGGFSGRESEVSVSWLADAVRAGKIRWVVVDASGGNGPGADGRVGARTAMTAVAATCKKIPASAYASGRGSTGGALYDCNGFANALDAYAAGQGTS